MLKAIHPAKSMLIDCPGCGRAYHIGGADLGEHGRTVMCPRCETRWFQRPAGRDIVVAAVSLRPLARLDEAQPAPRTLRLPRFALAATCAALVLASAAALVLGRSTVVRFMPRSAALYAAARMPVNLDGLVFAHIAPERLPSSDVTIHGTLRNVAGHRIHVPRLTFEVRDASGMTLVAWREAAPAKALAAGGEVGFTSTPHRLPSDSRTVLVRME